MSSFVASPTSSGSAALTKALKQVFYIHKDVVADLKAQLDIITEKYKQLKTELDKKTKSNKCKSCEHLQEVNQAIQNDFAIQLKKKEAIIQRLRDQLNHHSSDTQSRPLTEEIVDPSTFKSQLSKEQSSPKHQDYEFRAQNNRVSYPKGNSEENKAHSRLQLSKHGKRYSRYEETPDAKRCKMETKLFGASSEDLAKSNCHNKKSVSDSLVVPETMDVDYYLDENETDDEINEKSLVSLEKFHPNRTCGNNLFDDELEREETLKSTNSESICTQVEKCDYNNAAVHSAPREMFEGKENRPGGTLITASIEKNIPEDENIEHQETLLDTTNETSLFILKKDLSFQSFSHSDLSQPSTLKQPFQEPKTNIFEGNGDEESSKKTFEMYAYPSLQFSSVEKTLVKSDAQFRVPPSPAVLASSPLTSENKVGLRNKLASCGACLEGNRNDVATFPHQQGSQRSLRSHSWSQSKGFNEEEMESLGMNGSLGPGVRLTSYLDTENEVCGGTAAGDIGMTSQNIDDTVAPHQLSPLKMCPTDASPLVRSRKHSGHSQDWKSKEEEEEEEVIAPSPQHDSASQFSVSESIPCSSRSFKFMGRPQRQRFQSTPFPVTNTTQDSDLEADETWKAQSPVPNVNVQIVGAEDDCDGGTEDYFQASFKQELHNSNKMQSLCDSFDRVPKKEEKDYAHVAVVRKKKEREKLLGFSCQECYEYYKHSDLSDEEMQKRIQACSRHRHRFQAPATPEHFWSLGIPDTADISAKDEETQHQAPAPRRRRRLQQRF